MSRADRLFALYYYLDSKGGRTLAELARRFEVSQRTIFRDLSALQQSGVAIEQVDGRYRRVTGAGRPVALDSGELELVRLSLSNPALERRRGPIARALRNLRDRLDAALRERASSATTLSGPDRTGEAGLNVLDQLEGAISAGRPVTIRYRSLSGGSDQERGVDPWKLFHREGAWYLIGRCHLHDEARLFRVDRVAWSRTESGRFEAPRDFDVGRMLESAWSVFVGQGKHEIVLRFAPALAALIENARHHPGEEKQRRPDGSIEYRVHLSSLEEIARWVVGFGGAVRVEAPPELVRRVHEIARGALGPAASAEETDP
jgi:predicted DNA-binding transcriptional regulator YafY